MNDSIYSFDVLTAQLKDQGLLCDASEVHGIMCGMLCGGMSFDDAQWMPALEDCVAEGNAFSSDLKQFLTRFFNITCQQLVEPDFTFTLCLPDDGFSINERGAALMLWVQGFMLGFGLYQDDLTQCSQDVKEGLEDFAQIARMDEQMDEDEESESALEEVIEYVRVSSMLCFGELGVPPQQPVPPSQLH